MAGRTTRERFLSEEPFIFVQDPPDWRWISFADAGRRITAWQDRLADLAPGTRIGIRPSPSAGALLADVAARSLGLLAVPLAAEASAIGSDEALADLVIEADGDSVLAPESGTEAVKEAVPQARRRELGGCVLNEGGDDWSEPAALSAASLEQTLGRLQELIGDSDGGAIIVHGRSLAEFGERLMLEWAMAGAASIVVAPTPESAALSAFWARPTVLHGSAPILREYASLFQAGERGQRGLAARFRRLRQVVVFGGRPLDVSTSGLFRDLGAKVVLFDRSGDAFPEAGC